MLVDVTRHAARAGREPNCGAVARRKSSGRGRVARHAGSTRVGAGHQRDDRSARMGVRRDVEIIDRVAALARAGQLAEVHVGVTRTARGVDSREANRRASTRRESSVLDLVAVPARHRRVTPLQRERRLPRVVDGDRELRRLDRVTGFARGADLREVHVRVTRHTKSRRRREA